jgi:hypothetical protein
MPAEFFLMRTSSPMEKADRIRCSARVGSNTAITVWVYGALLHG